MNAQFQVGIVQNFWLWLLLAFLLGLLIEWLLEIFFFRRNAGRRGQDHDQTLASLQAVENDKSALSAKFDAANKTNVDLSAKLDAANQANADLNARLAKLEGDYRAQLDAANQANADLNARLAKLEGDYRAQLDTANQANVKLETDLGALNQEKSGLLEKIAAFTAGAGAATLSIKTLEQDKGALSAQLDAAKNSNVDLSAKLDAANRANADLNVQLQTLDADYRVRFEAAEQARAQLEREKAECAALAGNLRAELAQTQNELAAQQARAVEPDARSIVVASPDPALQNLAPADITFEAETEAPLASDTTRKRERQTPHTLAPQTARDSEDETPYETACPQHLSDVYGIGSVFEQRLYGAGIGTFWQLYKMPFDQLRQVLNLKGLQKESVDLKTIRADALRLAKETASKGRLWNGAQPDDLEPLEGIGAVYEKRLYDAGICTYAALAQATPEQLEAICGKGSARKPNFKAWIKQAQKLAARNN